MSEAMHRTLDRVARYFESLTPDALHGLDDIYAPDAVFKDPFNEVRGLAAIRAVYAHMFEALVVPRFAVTGRWLAGESAVLRWRFDADGIRGRGAMPISFSGLTLCEFDASGHIAVHRDYWDAAEEVYERIPVLGALLRLVKRRMRVQIDAGS